MVFRWHFERVLEKRGTDGVRGDGRTRGDCENGESLCIDMKNE